MLSTNILILIGTAVFIIILWTVIGIKHLSNLSKNTDQVWNNVNVKLKKRYDLLPLLIETIRIYKKDAEDMISTCIALRQKAVLKYYPDAEKLEAEHNLTQVINQLFYLGISVKELLNDSVYLELRKEIDELEKSTDENTKLFNEAVRKYNSTRKSIFLILLSLIFSFKEKNIFEFEV